MSCVNTGGQAAGGVNDRSNRARLAARKKSPCTKAGFSMSFFDKVNTIQNYFGLAFTAAIPQSVIGEANKLMGIDPGAASLKGVPVQ